MLSFFLGLDNIFQHILLQDITGNTHNLWNKQIAIISQMWHRAKVYFTCTSRSMYSIWTNSSQPSWKNTQGRLDRQTDWWMDGQTDWTLYHITQFHLGRVGNNNMRVRYIITVHHSTIRRLGNKTKTKTVKPKPKPWILWGIPYPMALCLQTYTANR